MAKVKFKIKNKIVAIIVVVLVALGAGAAVLIPTHSGQEAEVEVDPAEATIEYSSDDVDALITTEDSEEGRGEATEEVQEDIPTVEAVDSGQRVESEDSSTETEELTEDVSARLEAGEEVGLGSTIDLSWLDVSTPTAFKNTTLGKCTNTDGAYGAQCYDLADAFWQKYANRRASTCGTGKAKGMIADGCWQKNAGSEFTYVSNWDDIQPGDWLFFSTGTWGHVGMAQGYPNGRYIVLLGQNQGGSSCSGGGAAANLINISNRDFIAALRPNSYIKAEPEPEPETSTTTATTETYTVKKADTLGHIALKLGWYTSVKGLFGDDGYAQKLADANGIANRGLIYPGQVIKRVAE